jgi:hypothetical protein
MGNRTHQECDTTRRKEATTHGPRVPDLEYQIRPKRAALRQQPLAKSTKQGGFGSHTGSFAKQVSAIPAKTATATSGMTNHEDLLWEQVPAESRENVKTTQEDVAKQMRSCLRALQV